MPDSPDKLRETSNRQVAGAIGITPDSLAALGLGGAVRNSDISQFVRAYYNDEIGQMFVTLIVDGEEIDIPLTDAQAAAFIGGATQPADE